MKVFNQSSTYSPDWIQQIPSSIAILDSDFKIVDASPNWLKTFKLEETGIKGESILSLFPEISQELKTRLSFSLEGLKDIQLIYKTKTEDSFIWNINPWKDGYGHIIGVTIKSESVSKTQKLELELQKTKMLLNEKGMIAKIGSWEFNVVTKELLWTPNVNSIYGVPKGFKPTLEKVFDFYKEGQSRDTLKQVFQEAVTSGKPWNENLQVIQESGSIIWVNSIGRPKFSNGVCTRIIGTVQNITETVSNKQKVEDVKEYKLLEHVAVGMAIIHIETGTIVGVNSKLLELLGAKKENVIHQDFQKFLNKDYTDQKEDILRQLEIDPTFGPVDLELKKEDGTSLFLNISGSLKTEPCGKRLLVITAQNNAKYAQKEKEFEKLLSSSNEKNEQLLNFAHMVSHNLKAHATNFSLLLNFLKEEEGEDERKELMKMVMNASDNLADTIKGLREVVAVKTSINEEKKELNLNEHIFMVEQNVMGLMKKCEGKIINEIPDDVSVKALPAYLESILTNCITNAIKYRQDDKKPLIILSVKKESDYVVISIEDNGKGIDLKKYGHKLFGLYNTFHQNKNARGIGLYITKTQIEAMNGKITVSSTVGVGSVFHIHFHKL